MTILILAPFVALIESEEQVRMIPAILLEERVVESASAIGGEKVLSSADTGCNMSEFINTLDDIS